MNFLNTSDFVAICMRGLVSSVEHIDIHCHFYLFIVDEITWPVRIAAWPVKSVIHRNSLGIL